MVKSLYQCLSLWIFFSNMVCNTFEAFFSVSGYFCLFEFFFLWTRYCRGCTLGKTLQPNCKSVELNVRNWIQTTEIKRLVVMHSIQVTSNWKMNETCFSLHPVLDTDFAAFTATTTTSFELLNIAHIEIYATREKTNVS